MKRALGLAALTVLELQPSEHIEVAAQAGYSHVGLRLIPVAGQKYEHRFDLPEIEARLAHTGVQVLDVEVFRLEPGTDVAAFEPVLATSARLKASDILVHGADPDAARLTDTFGRLCDLAARYDLKASLEPMPWVDVSNVDKTMRILDGAGRQNCGLLVDPIHFFRNGDTVAALAKVPRQRLHYMQFCDARAETPADLQEIIRQARGDRLFPGEGGLDLKGLLRALPATLPMCLEVPIAQAMPPLERARRALAATEALL